VHFATWSHARRGVRAFHPVPLAAGAESSLRSPMLPPKAAVKTSVDYAKRSKAGIAAALRDARAARLEPPPKGEHARRLFYGFAVPLTLFRIAWGDARARAAMKRRLLPALACLIVAGAVATSFVSNRRVAEELSVVATDEDARPASKAKDDEDVAGLPEGLRVTVTRARDAAAAAAPPPKPAPSGRFSALHAAFDVLTSRVGSVIAALGIVEWILIWIGREHHDHIAYETSVLTGVIGEPIERPAKLRLDFGWLKMKAWRAVRFLLFLLLVSPIAWLVGRVPVVGPVLSITIEAVWGAYWASVFAVANTFVAWDDDSNAKLPWFLRVLARVDHVPVIGKLARLYARLLTFATRKVWPACMAFEETPWESAGLALSRGIATVPFVYLVFRPMFAPAATHALLGRRGANAVELPASPVAAIALSTAQPS
jgi:hypothetical protein